MKKVLPYLIFGLIATAFLYWKYRVAPSIDHQDIQVLIDGKPTSLNSQIQEGALINYYASWCGDCLKEMDALQQLHASGTIQVIGLTDDSPAKIEAIRKKFNLTFPCYQIPSELKDQGINVLPTTYIINADGKTTKSFIGAQNWNSEEFMNNYPTWLSLQ